MLLFLFLRRWGDDECLARFPVISATAADANVGCAFQSEMLLLVSLRKAAASYWIPVYTNKSCRIRAETCLGNVAKGMCGQNSGTPPSQSRQPTTPSTSFLVGDLTDRWDFANCGEGYVAIPGLSDGSTRSEGRARICKLRKTWGYADRERLDCASCPQL